MGSTAPAPIPWMKRNRTSIPIDWESPHRSEPARKIVTPAMNTGLRPYRSASLPKIGVVTACISRYEEKTQLYSEKPPRREAMLGIAVATIVPSMAARNIATTSALRTRDLCVRRGAPAVRSMVANCCRQLPVSPESRKKMGPRPMLVNRWGENPRDARNWSRACVANSLNAVLRT